MTQNFSNSNVVASSSIHVENVFVLTFQVSVLLYSLIVERSLIKYHVYFVPDLTVACATAFCEKRYEYVDVYVFVSKKCDKSIDGARKKRLVDANHLFQFTLSMVVTITTVSKRTVFRKLSWGFFPCHSVIGLFQNVCLLGLIHGRRWEEIDCLRYHMSVIIIQCSQLFPLLYLALCPIQKMASQEESENKPRASIL